MFVMHVMYQNPIYSKTEIKACQNQIYKGIFQHPNLCTDDFSPVIQSASIC